jgi:hypothetical protein
MLHEKSMEFPLVLIVAATQYHGTMALSTGVARACDMDCRQVAFSFAIPRGSEGLTGTENSRGHSETTADTDAA